MPLSLVISRYQTCETIISDRITERKRPKGSREDCVWCFLCVASQLNGGEAKGAFSLCHNEKLISHDLLFSHRTYCICVLRKCPVLL